MFPKTKGFCYYCSSLLTSARRGLEEAESAKSDIPICLYDLDISNSPFVGFLIKRSI